MGQAQAVSQQMGPVLLDELAQIATKIAQKCRKKRARLQTLGVPVSQKLIAQSFIVR